MVATSGDTALSLAQRFAPDLILLDVNMPHMDGFDVCRLLKQADATRAIPVVFLTARDDTGDVVKGFDVGGVDYVLKPFRREEVLVRIRTHLEKARLERALREKNAALEAEVARRQIVTRQRDQLAEREAQRWGLGEFVGQSAPLRKILDEVDLLQSARQTSVLIQGESGTGKELIARAIHSGSERKNQPFIAVNCASIPRDLADSLLFGHVRGAFTGADREQTGYFELADGGVLFLDEVGTLPLELQPKLLRVLEEKSVLPLGARQSRAVDVRILAATNADLAAEARAGTFRQDLYFRLARFTVRVPPLRERRGDIALLVRHFVQALAVEMGIGAPDVTAAALVRLESYAFPGNVRELKNIVERALIECRGDAIKPAHLHLIDSTPPQPIPHGELPLNLEQAELMLIERALEQSGGNISGAARLLGIERTKIYRRLGQLDKRTASDNEK